MGGDVGDRLPPVADAVGEVPHMRDRQRAVVAEVAVDGFDRAFRQRVGRHLLDRRAGQPAAVDEDPPGGALEQDAVLAAVNRHRHLTGGRRVTAQALRIRQLGEQAADRERERHRVGVVARGEAVLERLRQRALAFDPRRAGVQPADRPLGNIDMVGTPIGELAAGVLDPPAERPMRPLRAVRPLRRRALPELVIEPLGDRLRRERAAVEPRVDADADRADLTEPPGPHQRDRLGKAASDLGPLLRADQQRASGPFGLANEVAALGDGDGRRLLEVHVLAGPERVDRHLRVPVIGRGDDDGIDVLAAEQVAIVGHAVERRARRVGEPFGGVVAGDAVDLGQRDQAAD